MVCLLIVSFLMLKISHTGLKLGDLQSKSRSTEYFLVTCGVVVPLLVVLTCFEARVAKD
jgi:hypothetical protein